MFATYKMKYLGYIITQQGIKADMDKVKAVWSFPTPINQTELQSFLELASYYRRFVEGFSTIAAPLHQLLKKNIDYQWTTAQEVAFHYLKQRLTSAPIL